MENPVRQIICVINSSRVKMMELVSPQQVDMNVNVRLDGKEKIVQITLILVTVSLFSILG